MIRRSARLPALLAVAAASLLAAACGSPASGPAGPTTPGAAPGGRLAVFAAASLKQTFTDIGARYQAQNPGWTVDFTFAGSSDLVTQLTQGARADVFASADTKNMDKAAKAGLVDGDPVAFARNTLIIVVAPGNPKRVASFADLARPGLSVVTCAPQVPCGSATATVETDTKVALSPVSEESSVTDVLNKVTTGQADAGLVYVTDARSAGAKVTAVPFPESAGAVNTYPIATLRDSGQKAAASRFVGLVTGAVGRSILAAAGFAAP